MNRRRYTKISAYWGRIILLIIMTGFSILALAAIIHGQKEIRKERERLALLEKFNQVLEEPDGQTDDMLNIGLTVSEEDTDTDLQQPEDTEQENVSPGLEESGQESEETQSSYAMQIVFLGDSILDNVREYDGVATLVADNCNARVYNMSMGGTSAALLKGEPYDYKTWNSRCLLGVVNAIVGNISGDIFEGYRAGEILTECNFEQTDYFIIEYGLNDFLSKIPAGKYLPDGTTKLPYEDIQTYVGALEEAIDMLHEAFPDAKIMLVSPHYCQFFSGETYLGDAYSLDYGCGNLVSYSQICSYVYETYKKDNLLFFDALLESGIKAETADWYLEDGIHLNADGRHLYADCISKRILADFYPVE